MNGSVKKVYTRWGDSYQSGQCTLVVLAIMTRVDIVEIVKTTLKDKLTKAQTFFVQVQVFCNPATRCKMTDRKLFSLNFILAHPRVFNACSREYPETIQPHNRGQ